MALQHPFSTRELSELTHHLYFLYSRMTAELAGTVTLECGTEVPANFSLVRERGSWKLLEHHIGS